MSAIVYSFLPTESLTREWNPCATRLGGADMYALHQQFEQNEQQMTCTECGGMNFDHDNSAGDLICLNCGLIQQEHMISEDAEWREFDDDTPEESKARVGFAYNPQIDVDLATKNNRMRDEKEFLQQGFRDIDTLLQKVFPERINQSVRTRSQLLFQKAFYLQRGEMKFDENAVRQTTATANRRRFSKRKQFVVAFVLQALKEHFKHFNLREDNKENTTKVGGKRAPKKTKQAKPYTLEQLNELMGWKVSKTSLKKVLKDIQLR
eukprot:TRINITY_DN1541_c0_g1_i1.p1 TRINITY_DN1541_c0_g1~~TRINITY_DN1541_c0_g1_i1.p1  ORF type:complete len:264 (-),score=61.08 TRINITY_DN1541_c0_g1_i1:101-892(-)